MTLKENWADGNIVRASDLNEITSTINSVATLTATDIQVSNYSTTAGKLVPCDAGQGSFSVFLPANPPDDARVSVKKIDNSVNTVTVSCTGSDRLDKVGGATSLILNVPGQVVTLQYDTYLAVWYVVSSDLNASTIGKTILQAADASAVRTIISAVSSGDSRLTDNRTPTDGSVSSGKMNSSYAATLATLTGSQTLTNKVLTDPKISSIYSPTNSTRALELSAPSSGVNYLSVTGSVAGSHPQLGAAGTDANISVDIYPKGSGALRLYGATGQTPTIQATGADTNHNLNLVGKGTGAVLAGGVPVVTTTGTQTLTGKTISGSSNTFSNIPAAAITGLSIEERASGLSGGADFEVLGGSKVSVISSAGIAGYTTAQAVIPTLYNDLAHHLSRGGTVTITKNGSAASATTDYSGATISSPFLPNFGWLTLMPGSTNDTYVIEVNHPYLTISTASVYGIDFKASTAARNVTIEVWQSNAWVSVGSITNNSTTNGYAKQTSSTTARTKVRYTLTNFATVSDCRIVSMYATVSNGVGASESFISRAGGNVYGTSSAPATFTAAGGDTNISLNLVSKGTGTVRANNVEVVTVSGTQTLTGKTIVGYAPLTNNVVAPQYLPTSSYSTYVGNGTAKTYVVTHNLNTFDVVISVWDAATGEEVNCDKYRTSNGTVTLTFAAAPSNNAYRVVILSNGNMGNVAGGSGSAWITSKISTAVILSSIPGTTYICLLDTGAVATLPTAIDNGSRYVLKNLTNNNMTVLTTSSQTVEGQSGLVLSAGASVELVSDGTGWRII